MSRYLTAILFFFMFSVVTAQWYGGGNPYGMYGGGPYGGGPYGGGPMYGGMYGHHHHHHDEDFGGPPPYYGNQMGGPYGGQMGGPYGGL